MIEIVANGIPYTDFVSASVTRSLESLANDFEFTASSVKGFPPLKVGDKVEILVDRKRQVTGYIGKASGNDQEGSHTVTYSGRDLTGDFIDSSINIIGDIRDGITLKGLIEIVIDHLGQPIKVIDNLNPEPFNAAEDIISPEVGDSAYDFVRKYAAKRQAMLTSDGDGNIVITQSSPADSGEALQRLVSSESNNILSQTFDIDSDKRFNKYISRGQLDTRAVNLGGDTGIDSIEDQGGEFVDSEVRAGRQRVDVESEGYSGEQLKNRAKWSSQIAKARALRFSCVAKGHSSPSGEVWQENTLVQINSEVADINRKMLINTVTFSEGEGQPTVTSFEFVEKDVYTIDEKTLSQKPVGKQGDIFLG